MNLAPELAPVSSYAVSEPFHQSGAPRPGTGSGRKVRAGTSRHARRNLNTNQNVATGRHPPGAADRGAPPRNGYSPLSYLNEMFKRAR